MIRKLALAASLALVASIAAAPQMASAVTVGSPAVVSGAAAEGSILLQVQSCRRIIRICAARWGTGNRAFRRCVRARGC
jgi:hypothetical protein